MLQSLILCLHKICNAVKQWIIHKTITITSINISYCFFLFLLLLLLLLLILILLLLLWHNGPYSLTLASFIMCPIQIYPNSGKLGFPRSRLSFTSVTDQLHSLATKNCMVRLKKFSLLNKELSYKEFLKLHMARRLNGNVQDKKVIVTIGLLTCSHSLAKTIHHSVMCRLRLRRYSIMGDVAFLLSINCIIQWVYCTTWPAVARAGEASTYSRRIAYIPANSNHIKNYFSVEFWKDF